MIAIFFICLILYLVLGIAAFIYAKRKNSLFWSDLSAPILVILFWVSITAIGYGHQSLSHFIEVPIALLASLILLNIRVFVIDRYRYKYKINLYTTLALSLLIVVLLRTFMPYMPE